MPLASGRLHDVLLAVVLCVAVVIVNIFLDGLAASKVHLGILRGKNNF